MMRKLGISLLGALLLVGWMEPGVAAPRKATRNDPRTIEALKSHLPKASCGDEAIRIRRAEAELPHLDRAPPDDQQIVCITIETNLLFMRRLAAHIRACPRSPYAGKAENWTRTEESYTAQFKQRRCKQAIKTYRG